MDQSPEKGGIVLLHGIFVPKYLMSFMAHYFRKRGYQVFNLSYPSIFKPLDELGKILHQKLNRPDIQSCKPLHFVTHSMGGLVLQEAFKIQKPQNLGRVVMTGPPHGGSEVADYFKTWPHYKLMFGPAGQELTTSHRKSFEEYEADYPLGVIAGTEQLVPYLGTGYFDGLHDGKVSVESTKIKGTTDHLELPIDHTLMTLSPKLCHQVRHFLEQGMFDRSQKEKSSEV